MSLFWTKAIVKAVNLDERTVDGFASTKQPDMTRDVILSSAWPKSLGRWKKRGSIPKFLAYHMHRLLTGHSPVLGPMLRLKVVPDGLLLKAEFAETELGNEHLHLYGIGAMDYFSVGFQIMKNGSTMHIDTVRQLLRDNKIKAKVPEEVDRVIFEAELLEVSAVVIGANLGALVTASATGNGCCGMCGENGGEKCKTDEEKAQRSTYANLILERLEKCAAIIPDGAGKAIYTDAEKYIEEVAREMTEDEAKKLWVPSTVLVDSKGAPIEEPVAEKEGDLDEIGEGIEELVHPKLLPLPELAEDGSVSEEALASAEERMAVATDPEGTEVDPLIEVHAKELEEKIWDETDENIRHRVRNPNLFIEGTFRTVKIKRDKPRVNSVMGKLKADGRTGPMKVQNLMFPKEDDWTLAKAKQWVKDHPDAVKSLEALDIDLMLSILERVEALEVRETEREKESKTFLETLAAAVEAKAGESGGTGSHEHQTVPPEGESGGKGGEVDGLKILEGVLGNLEKLSGPDEGTD